jgi:hypothetical protein
VYNLSSKLIQHFCSITSHGLNLYQWNGSDAGVSEKRKANEIVQSLREERLGKAKIHVMEDNEDVPEFWKIVGDKNNVKSAQEGGDDNAIAKKITNKLLKVSNESGKMEMAEVASGVLKKSMLDTNDVFIVDSDPTMFVWVGNGANKEERSQAFNYANAYLSQNGRPMTTPVVRVVEGSNNAAFEAVFNEGVPSPRFSKRSM